MATRLVLNRALSLAPDLDITVRAHNDSELDPLYQLGAKEVVQPEFEAGLEIGAHVLLTLGESGAMVQQVVNRYRQGRYRDILPERSQYLGVSNFDQAIEGLNITGIAYLQAMNSLAKPSLLSIFVAELV